jgi:hypothetical protein
MKRKTSGCAFPVGGNNKQISNNTNLFLLFLKPCILFLQVSNFKFQLVCIGLYEASKKEGKPAFRKRNPSELYFTQLEQKRDISCFLALDRAADSRFLIIRLCRRSPELPSDSGTLFFPKDGKPVEEVRASNGLLKEVTLECKCEVGLSGSE